MARVRLPFLLLMPVVAIIATASVTLAVRSGDDGNGANGKAPTVVMQLARSQPPTPTPPAPTPTAVPDRTSCSEIRGTAYRSDGEQTWYQTNCLTATTASASSPVTAPPPSTTTASSGVIYGSGDRLVIARLGINAPVNIYVIGEDGAMGNPVGPTDVALEDFRNFPGLGGYPGSGGNAVLAGHVDYRNYGLAVFAPLRSGIAVGDIIEYYRADGQVVTYRVDWFGDYSPSDNWAAIVAATAQESMTLVTCVGEFDYATRQYSQRRVVRAVRI